MTTNWKQHLRSIVLAGGAITGCSASSNPDVCTALQRDLSVAFATIEQQQMVPVLARLERGAPFDPACAALGVIPSERRVDAFYGAITTRVLPRLTALGLNGPAAWNDRYALIACHGAKRPGGH